MEQIELFGYQQFVIARRNDPHFAHRKLGPAFCEFFRLDTEKYSYFYEVETFEQLNELVEKKVLLN